MGDVALYPYRGIWPRVAHSAFIAPGARLVGDVEIGEEASVWFNAVLRGDLNRVRVGERSNIQDGAVLHVARDLSCCIGAEVTIGHCAVAHACVIEDGCLIGMNAVILSGAVIGAGSLIAAGAVVREHTVIPPRSLVAGLPAKVIRALDEDAGRRFAASYVEEAARYRTEYGDWAAR